MPISGFGFVGVGFGSRISLLVVACGLEICCEVSRLLFLLSEGNMFDHGVASV